MIEESKPSFSSKLILFLASLLVHPYLWARRVILKDEMVVIRENVYYPKKWMI